MTGGPDPDSDPDLVSVLGHEGVIMGLLRDEQGRWRVPDVEPLRLPGVEAPTIGAIVDTGVRRDHPTLVGRIAAEADVTGEGVEDTNGHGTAVAAILASTQPEMQIISVKALDGNGKTDVATLCLGLREAVRLLDGRRAVINVSAGRRLDSCDGDCAVCSTVLELQRDHGVIFVCAAGNSPGATYCPARVAISVTVPDDFAAVGDFVQPVPNWRIAD